MAMSWPGKTKIPLSVSLEKMSDRCEKTYKDTISHQMAQIICALLNSRGGELTLLFDAPAGRNQLERVMRTLKKNISHFARRPPALYFNVVPEKTSLEITVFKPKTNSIYTMHYNLYLPSVSQVNELSATEPIKTIRDILRKVVLNPKAIEPDSHLKQFTLGSAVGFRESKTVQFKCLEDKRTKKSSLSQRLLKSGKLLAYVSAFANYRGGHIYYGIGDDSIVQGEELTPKDQIELKDKISKAILGMIWPDNSHTQGEVEKQWQVEFEEVRDTNGEIVPSTYVIVIYVPQCPGGVFTKEPESYEIKDNKAKKIGFHTWKRYIIEGLERDEGDGYEGYSSSLHKSNKQEERDGSEGQSSSGHKSNKQEEIGKTKDLSASSCQKMFQDRVRSKAVKFMSENPRCVRVIPCKDNIVYIYVVPESKETIESVRFAAKEMFDDCAFKVVNLLQRRMDKLLIRLPRKQKNKGKELSELAHEIEKNLRKFENRQNVTAVEPAYKVVDFEEKNEVCVRIYVLGKGKIPLYETDFNELEELKDYPYDVVEGFFSPSCSNTSTSYPLRGGVSIGVKGIKEVGTLGGFVTDENRIGQRYILSCQHVLNPNDESYSSRVGRIVQPSELDKLEGEKKINEELRKKKEQLKLQESKETTFSDDEDKLKRIKAKIAEIKTEIEKLETKVGNLSTREIGNYVCGIKQNVMLDGNRVYVDAALAELDENEILEVECNGETNATVDENNRIFGFGSDPRTSNRIIELENVINDEDNMDEEYARLFSKCGRSTGLTTKGQLETRHFFVNLNGYRPAGALQSYPIKYYCISCSPADDAAIEMQNGNRVRGERCEGCHTELSHENTSTLWAYNCLSFRQPLKPFAEEGDSGSIIFDETGGACALIFGVFNSQEALITLATPLQHIVEAFEQEKGIRIQLWSVCDGVRQTNAHENDGKWWSNYCALL